MVRPQQPTTGPRPLSRATGWGRRYLLGVILIAGWTIFLIATERSLGALGSIIGAAVIGTGIWLLVDLGALHPESVTTIARPALFALATLLAVGLSRSLIWRRLSGQLEVDED